jgi:hypothetical protein
LLPASSHFQGKRLDFPTNLNIPSTVIFSKRSGLQTSITLLYTPQYLVEYKDRNYVYLLKVILYALNMNDLAYKFYKPKLYLTRKIVFIFSRVRNMSNNFIIFLFLSVHPSVPWNSASKGQIFTKFDFEYIYIYTHTHITKQYKATTAQIKTNTVQDIPKWNSQNIIKWPQYKVQNNAEKCDGAKQPTDANIITGMRFSMLDK